MHHCGCGFAALSNLSIFTTENFRAADFGFLDSLVIGEPMLKKALILVLVGPGCIYAQGAPKPTPSAQVQSSGKTQRLHPTPPGKPSSIASSSKTVEGPPTRLTLKEAESIALRNAPVLGSAYFNAQAAKDVVKEVRSQFFPQVEGVIEAVGTSNAIRNEFAGTNHTVPQSA